MRTVTRSSTWAAVLLARRPARQRLTRRPLDLAVRGRGWPTPPSHQSQGRTPVACHLDRRVRPDQGAAAYTVRVGRFLALVRGLSIWQGMAWVGRITGGR